MGLNMATQAPAPHHTTATATPAVPGVSALPSTPHAPPTPIGLHWPSLLVGLVLMVVLTVYPPLLTNAQGKADHTLAALLLVAMSTGLVNGVGFIPRWAVWRWLLSGWTCVAALALAAWLVLGR